MAPTERSMPAVRMMRVWPTARAATTAVCWIISEIEAGLAKRGLIRLKTTTVATRIRAGLMNGLPCSRCWTRCWGLCRRRASSWAAAPGAVAVVTEILFSPGMGRDRTRVDRRPVAGRPSTRVRVRGGSAPAEAGALGGVDALHAVGRLVGHQRDAGVEEVQTLVVSGLAPPLAILAIASTPREAIFSGYCCEVAPMTPSLTDVDAVAATVDGHDERVLLLAGRLEGVVGADRGGLVDGVDDVDARRPWSGSSPSPCGRRPRSPGWARCRRSCRCRRRSRRSCPRRRSS